jgi:hypothetical protein
LCCFIDRRCEEQEKPHLYGLYLIEMNVKLPVKLPDYKPLNRYIQLSLNNYLTNRRLIW